MGSSPQTTLLMLCVVLVAAPGCLGQIKSPLLQIWGVNLAGTQRLTPAEIWGVGLEKTQSVPFDPDAGTRLRSEFEATFGAGGQNLIDLLGSGKHVDDVVKDLRSAHNNRVVRQKQNFNPQFRN